MKLHPYQVTAKASVSKGYANGLHRAGISLPTGTGKTVIFSDVAYDVWRNNKRVIVLVHLDTLVGQTVSKLVAAGVPAHVIGIVKAEKNEVNAPVIVASIQTLARPNRLEQIIPPHLTVVDEAHLSMAPRYLRYFQHVGAVPGGPGYLLGLTATWERTDGVGLGDIWEKIVFKRSIKWAVENGYLVMPRAIQYGPEGLGSHLDLDTSGVRTVKNRDSENYGDYNPRDLEDLVMVEDLLETAIKGYNEHGRGRDGNLLPAALFAPTQASVRYFLKGFNDAGIPAAEILSGTTKSERIWNFSGFDQGSIIVLGSCTALAVGWDSPRCCVMLGLRPTKSRVMFVQQLGRILRLWPGKTEGLLIDYVGLTDDKDLATHIDLSTTVERTSDNPCPECARGLCEECLGCRNGRCDYFNCVCDVQEDEVESEPQQHVAKKIRGLKEVDLFAGTSARWLMTYRNVPFVQTAEHTYFVAPHEGMFAVGRCGAKSMRCACHGNGRWLATGLASDEALDLGSDYALEDDPSLAHKNASWRKGNQPPSQNQLNYARSIGITPDGLSKHELADQISIRIASKLLAGLGG